MSWTKLEKLGQLYSLENSKKQLKDHPLDYIIKLTRDTARAFRIRNNFCREQKAASNLACTVETISLFQYIDNFF